MKGRMLREVWRSCRAFTNLVAYKVKDCYNFHVRSIVFKVYIEIIYFRKGSIYVNWSIGSRRH